MFPGSCCLRARAGLTEGTTWVAHNRSLSPSATSAGTRRRARQRRFAPLMLLLSCGAPRRPRPHHRRQLAPAGCLCCCRAAPGTASPTRPSLLLPFFHLLRRAGRSARGRRRRDTGSAGRPLRGCTAAASPRPEPRALAARRPVRPEPRRARGHLLRPVPPLRAQSERSARHGPWRRVVWRNPWSEVPRGAPPRRRR